MTRRTPDRWPPMKADPRIDAIPESSWVTVTPVLLALMHAQHRADREAFENARLKAQPRQRRSVH